MFILNPIAGILFIVGHEKVSSTFSPKEMTTFANMFVVITSILTFAVMLLALIDYNEPLYPNIPSFSNM
jgi:hypothetical protein